jgi:hypothetical protein
MLGLLGSTLLLTSLAFPWAEGLEQHHAFDDWHGVVIAAAGVFGLVSVIASATRLPVSQVTEAWFLVAGVSTVTIGHYWLSVIGSHDSSDLLFSGGVTVRHEPGLVLASFAASFMLLAAISSLSRLPMDFSLRRPASP